MKLIVQTLDLNETRARWPENTPFRPAYIGNRKTTKDKWIVLSEPMLPGGKPVWSYSEHDEFVRVPLFPYMLNPRGDLALAFMLQLGLSCAAQLPGKVTGLMIVTGNPVALIYDPLDDTTKSMQYWVGFGVTVESD